MKKKPTPTLTTPKATPTELLNLVELECLGRDGTKEVGPDGLTSELGDGPFSEGISASAGDGVADGESE